MRMLPISPSSTDTVAPYANDKVWPSHIHSINDTLMVLLATTQVNVQASEIGPYHRINTAAVLVLQHGMQIGVPVLTHVSVCAWMPLARQLPFPASPRTLWRVVPSTRSMVLEFGTADRSSPITPHNPFSREAFHSRVPVKDHEEICDTPMFVRYNFKDDDEFLLTCAFAGGPNLPNATVGEIITLPQAIRGPYRSPHRMRTLGANFLAFGVPSCIPSCSIPRAFLEFTVKSPSFLRSRQDLLNSISSSFHIFNRD